MSQVSFQQRERGMVLVTSLLLLVVVTILAVGMFRSFGTDEKIAGNSREKQLSFSAAESAEAFAEWWIGTGAAGNGLVVLPSCSGTVTAPASAAQVCGTAQSTTALTTVPWTLGNTYTLPANIAGTYALWAQPQFYVYKFPSGISGKSYYQIDAVGYGGSPSTTSEIEVVVVCTQKVGSSGPMGTAAAQQAAC